MRLEGSYSWWNSLILFELIENLVKLRKPHGQENFNLLEEIETEEKKKQKKMCRCGFMGYFVSWMLFIFC